jgi:hypothetical protein
MSKPLPPHPNVRKCTHIKVTGQQCGSPALRGEFFCYFHTRVIKGVPVRVHMSFDAMALLEDHEAIQFSIMTVVDGLVKGTLDFPRARLIIQALRIAARNANHVRFDNCYYEKDEQEMVREVPDYARQYLIEHPEFGPPLDLKNKKNGSCGAGAPAREPETNALAQRSESLAQSEALAQSVGAQRNVSPESATAESAAERRQNTAHGASRGTEAENDPAPKERKNPRANPPSAQERKERELIRRAEAAIEGATRGNWRDLRTVFEFADISERSKEAPS